MKQRSDIDIEKYVELIKDLLMKYESYFNNKTERKIKSKKNNKWFENKLKIILNYYINTFYNVDILYLILENQILTLLKFFLLIC